MEETPSVIDSIFSVPKSQASTRPEGLWFAVDPATGYETVNARPFAPMTRP